MNARLDFNSKIHQVLRAYLYYTGKHGQYSLSLTYLFIWNYFCLLFPELVTYFVCITENIENLSN